MVDDVNPIEALASGGGGGCGNRQEFTPTLLARLPRSPAPAATLNLRSHTAEEELDLDRTIVTFIPGLSCRPSHSHWRDPQRRGSRDHSLRLLSLHPLLPSHPRSVSRNPPPGKKKDICRMDSELRSPASSPRWTTSRRWSTAGWRGSRWGRGSCTWGKSWQFWHIWLRLYLSFPSEESLAQMWKAWQSASGSA